MMRHIHWVTLVIGLAAGYWILPSVVAAVRGARG